MMKAGKVLKWLPAIAAWAICIGVIAHYNIAPSLDRNVNSSAMAQIAVQLLCAVLLSLVKIDRGRNLSRWENVILSTVLVTISVCAGMDTRNHIKETATGPNANLIALAETYQPQIDKLGGQITALGTFDPTSAKQVEAAQNAVKEAIWQTRVCGHNCDMEAKEGAVDKAQKRLDQLSAWQTKTDTKKDLEKELKEAQAKLAALGNIPQHVDRTAAQIADLIGGGVTEKDVTKWQPLVWAVFMEVINRIAPGWLFLLFLELTGNKEAALEKARCDTAAAPLAMSAAQTAKPRGKKAAPALRQEAAASAASPADETRQVIPLRRAVKPTLREVETLKQRGMSNRKIAALYGVDESTIRRVLKRVAAAAAA